MPYARLLNEYIEKSEMSTREIAKKCAKAGQSVSASYISILKNETNNRVPSDDLSRVLEKILGIDDNLLVLEAYLDNAPDMLVTALRNFYRVSLNVVLNNYLSKDLSEEQKNLAFEEADKLPLSTIVLELSKYEDVGEYSSTESTIEENVDGTNYIAKMLFDTDLEVLDDALSPMIKKGSKVKIKLEAEYKNGDIIAYKTKHDDVMKIRKLIVDKKGKCMMFPFNTEFDTEEYKRDELKILGRVDAVLTKI